MNEGSLGEARSAIDELLAGYREELVSVAVRPDVCVVEGEMKPHELKLLKRWIDLNREVLMRFWDGEIEYAEDVLNELRSI